MSVFRNYQIAMDVARYTMIIYDGVDTIRYEARGIEPDSGAEIEPPDGTPLLTHVKERIRSHSNAALVNHNALTTYVGKIGLANAKAAVTAVFGVNADDLQTELTKLRDIAQYAYNNVLSATSMAQLAAQADSVDAQLEKWVSIRRRWAL